jgi:hypothetical protein
MLPAAGLCSSQILNLLVEIYYEGDHKADTNLFLQIGCRYRLDALFSSPASALALSDQHLRRRNCQFYKLSLFLDHPVGFLDRNKGCRKVLFSTIFYFHGTERLES